MSKMAYMMLFTGSFGMNVVMLVGMGRIGTTLAGFLFAGAVIAITAIESHNQYKDKS